MDKTFKESAFTPKLGQVRPSEVFWGKRRRTDETTVTHLVEALARDGRFLQQIGVRDEGAPGYRLRGAAGRTIIQLTVDHRVLERLLTFDAEAADLEDGGDDEHDVDDEEDGPTVVVQLAPPKVIRRKRTPSKASGEVR